MVLCHTCLKNRLISFATFQGKTIGMFSKDKMSGEAYDQWNSQIDNSGFTKTDISLFVAYIMAPKDEKELLLMKKASQATVDMFRRYYYEEILKAIDQEKVSRECVKRGISSSNEGISCMHLVPEMSMNEEQLLVFSEGNNIITNDKEHVHVTGVKCWVLISLKQIEPCTFFGSRLHCVSFSTRGKWHFYTWSNRWIVPLFVMFADRRSSFGTIDSTEWHEFNDGSVSSRSTCGLSMGKGQWYFLRLMWCM